ncbi:UBX domain-containing protein 1 [Diplogelasinospora grovesii]|uniref:UBX domain-containing protein 1 n=1 Tax=Diplogelasinospora grovesii TaxID=303347 RepID=A0AAN6N9B9_9PEZI|nr:UBX domain-containing protein 1 [Diplogelasinospora grovesii]
MSGHDDLISDFCALTGASADQATEYLTASRWDMGSAVTSYFTDMEEGHQEAGSEPASSSTPAQPEYTGPRTLDGRPAPQYASASSSSTSKKPQKRTGFATLSSLGGGNNDDDDDDEDDDDERRGPRDLFAGGEKSGLAVQDPSQRGGPSDPKKLINDILAKAKAQSRRPDADATGSQAGSSRSIFRGAGQTLGGDGVESRTIPDPRAAPPSASGRAIPTQAENLPVQERTLHIWQDGFSIDDGELRRFDDPQNQADLQMIRQGQAPLHLMNLRYDQRVDVKLQQHNEKYRPLPKVYRPFGGEGRRLGSPVPGEASVAPPPATTTTTATAPPATAAGPSAQMGANESQPTLLLRIQMPDGSRLPARFNPSQTVGDVYDFVQRASSSVSGRPWVLATTFPTKEHKDQGLVLGEMPEFKKGGAAVVKWA